jgi:hypothetical protein
MRLTCPQRGEVFRLSKNPQGSGTGRTFFACAKRETISWTVRPSSANLRFSLWKPAAARVVEAPTTEEPNGREVMR